MSDIVLNADGTSIWTNPQEKLEEVKNSLLPHLQRIKTKWDYNESSAFPRKLEFNAQISQRVTLTLRKFPIVPSKYATELDIDLLRDYIDTFYQMVEFIMDFYEDFLVTKVLFCQFLGIDTWTYNQLLLSPDPDILTEMRIVDEMFVNATLLSAQIGKTKEKSSEIRMRVDGVGHSVEMKPSGDEKTTINLISYDPDSVKRSLANMGIKLLDNNKK